MPNPNVNFSGETLILPGAYTQNNVNWANPAATLTSNPLIFIAQGYGGQPNTPIPTSSAQQLQTLMRGAPSASFASFLYGGGGSLVGANQVTYINASPNTQSTSTITATGGTTVINLTSADYGTPSNLLSYSIVAGTQSPGIDFTFTDGFSGNSKTGYNLGLIAQLAYTGTATGGVSFQVTGTAGVPTTLTLISPQAGESFGLTLANFTTVTGLINYINGTGVYAANTISSSAGGGAPTTLDIMPTAVSLPPPTISSGITTYVFENVTGIVGDLAYWINTFGGSFATAVIPSSVTSSPTTVIA
ncbi:MAG: hypothetical protein ACYCOU_14805, partial [Sulfobacillus sp.]